MPEAMTLKGKIRDLLIHAKRDQEEAFIKLKLQKKHNEGFNISHLRADNQSSPLKRRVQIKKTVALNKSLLA